MASNGTRYKKRRRENKGKNLILSIMLIFFIGLFIFSGTKIINYIIDTNKNQKIFDEISESITVKNEENEDTENRYKIDFETLKQKNSDTVGFLKVNGTDIEQIVVQSNDNSYYLNHNFNKDINSSGWIFADYRNKLDGTDKNIIIYGHNMKNGTMFSSLKNVLTDKWYSNKENRYLTFISDKDNNIYEIFSVYQIEEEDYYIKTDFIKEDFENYVKTVTARSKYSFGVDVRKDDSLITLSTCGNSSKYRIVVHAKKIN